jgi:hypothetical protein
MRRLSIAAILGIYLALSGCDKRSPSKDEAPIIREQIGRIAAALQKQNRTALDSLVSEDIGDDGLTVDSLISFVWGISGEKRFDHFGPSEIIYNKKKARFDCPLVDSSGNQYLNVTWTLVRENDQWLLKRFETGVRPIDSTQ